MRKFLGLVVLAFILCSYTQAEAVVLFQEDFNTAPNITALPPYNPGVPVTPGADNNWYAARFDGSGSSSSSIAADVGRSSWPLLDFSLNAHGWAVDDAGLLIGISTSGYENVLWDFDWYTVLLESNDDLMAGYYVGDITGFVSRTKDLRDSTADPASTSNWVWTTLGRSLLPTHSTIALPGNEEHLWIAFWLDDGSSDFGKFDNIVITGDPYTEHNSTPEPATLYLMGTGIFGLIRFRRSKQK